METSTAKMGIAGNAQTAMARAKVNRGWTMTLCQPIFGWVEREGMDRQMRLNVVYIKAVRFTFSLYIAPRDRQSRILYGGESVLNDRGTVTVGMNETYMHHLLIMT